MTENPVKENPISRKPIRRNPIVETMTGGCESEHSRCLPAFACWRSVLL